MDLECGGSTPIWIFGCLDYGRFPTIQSGVEPPHSKTVPLVVDHLRSAHSRQSPPLCQRPPVFQTGLSLTPAQPVRLAPGANCRELTQANFCRCAARRIEITRAG